MAGSKQPTLYNLFEKHRFFSEQDVLEYMQSQRLSVADSHRN